MRHLINLVEAAMPSQAERYYAANYSEEELAEIRQDPRYPLNLPNDGNTFVWRDRQYAFGAFDVRDGEIVKAYPYYKAYDGDFPNPARACA